MPMKLGEYYTLDETAKILKIGKPRLRDIIYSGELRVEYFGRTPAVHRDALAKLEGIRDSRNLGRQRDAKETLLLNGFTYFHQPKGGMDGKGNPKIKEEKRRGWHRLRRAVFLDKDKKEHIATTWKFYGLTAVDALKAWKIHLINY